MIRVLLSLTLLLVAAIPVGANGYGAAVVQVRSRVVVPYAPVIQQVYAAPIVQQVYAQPVVAVQAYSSYCQQAVIAAPVYAKPVLAVQSYAPAFVQQSYYAQQFVQGHHAQAIGFGQFRQRSSVNVNIGNRGGLFSGLFNRGGRQTIVQRSRTVVRSR